MIELPLPAPFSLAVLTSNLDSQQLSGGWLQPRYLVKSLDLAQDKHFGVYALNGMTICSYN
ncbi:MULTISPECIES: hypothetical protein [unclassified Microcystis]|jgi:hypothetical protein|uniref:hypothetical protein n=1 Tax=unclassified Microcystis TaxID=2643300 RepID=UPI0022C6BF31|nr:MULTISPECIES: hypothetical protein [unclassified Microcystis]MCA2691454.1 hypothetical protein [Microcystis sp. M034S2]MCA2751941.1 hypothetical protein [Microcystis sp. M144S2]MCZ8200330.1 hypothetical protein [Microcystis sp. LE19-55.1A]MCZ8307458.1 hypothetical protein [Microcystis sp. LE19-98.1E]